MSRVNLDLIKAGLWYLIDKDKESFVDRMAVYLQERVDVMDFLFKGPLPINDEIKDQIKEFIKASIPCADDFKELVSVEIGFNYSSNQYYNVVYKANRYYTEDKRPYQGEPVRDDDHQVCILTEVTVSVDPTSLKL